MTDTTSAGGAVASPVAETPVAVPDFKGTKHKIKIEQQEMEVPYEELLSGYQQAQASQKRFREASELSKKAEESQRQIWQQIERAKQDPEFLAQLLSQFGVDPDKWSETRVMKILEREAMNPDQRRALEAEERVKKFEAEKAEREQKEKSARQAQLEAQAAQEIQTDVLNALQKLGIKPTWEMIALAAEQMEASLEGRGVKIDAETALSRVHQKTLRDAGMYFDALPDERLFEVLPKSLLERIRKQEIKNLTQNKPFSKETSSKPIAPSTPPGKKKVMSTEDFFKLKEKQLRG